LVISSDFSHYPDAKTEEKVDRDLINAILTGDKAIFERKFQQLENSGLPGIETPACGYQAIRAGLRLGEILGFNYRQISFGNSGDAAGDYSKVVGYATIIGFEAKEGTDGVLDSSAKKEALEIARKTLEEYLTNQRPTKIIPKSKVLKQKLGVFVTLKKDDQLRGCIGELEPNQPLAKLIQKTAIAAATQDPRFFPVSAEELEAIKIEISVLTPLKKISDWRQIQLGKQGVVIRQGSRGGVFLPQVAEETSWSLEEFLSELCEQKAGLPANCYQNPRTEIYTFEAEVFGE
jgi:hypothetical protein